MALYEQLGYTCRAISALDQHDTDKVKALIEHKTSLFSGHSGVGKSTLLNRLAPGIQQKTAEVSTFANKGVHTTTYAEMFILSNHTFVIDTPGIKELGLIDINEGELSHYFPEMRDLLGSLQISITVHIPMNLDVPSAKR